MKLDAWLKQDHPLVDRLLVVERLSQALNEAHDRGEPLAALQPDTIDVAGDGRVDFSGARRGTPAAGYGAPERLEGGPLSPEADVYSAGAVAWEVLCGRPCGPSPTHLSEASPELPQELADAVMACLERSPQWRPRDLTYLAQLAQHAQGGRRRAEPQPRAAQPTPRAPARAGGARGARATAGRASGEGSATRLRLAIGVVLALGVTGAGSYLWFARSGDRGARGPVAAASPVMPNPPTATTTTTTPTQAPAETSATPGGAPSPAPAAPRPAATAGALPVATQPPTSAPTAPTTTTTTLRAIATPPVAAAAADPVTSRPQPSARTSAAPPVTPPAAPPGPAASQPQSQAPSQPQPQTPGAAATDAAAPRVPLALAAVSPLSARRPGKVLLDLRGAGIHDGIRVRVLPLRDVPRGIQIVRLKLESDTLVRVLLDLDAQVAPGAYAIALEDSDGRQTKPLTFTVTR